VNETTHTLRFPDLDREIPVSEDETLYQSARRHGVRIVGACGGRGTCGSCVVRVAAGEVSHVNGETVKPSKWQRACQLFARSDCTLEVAPRSLAPVVRAETDTETKERLPLASPLRRSDISLPAASLQDTLADHDRVLRELGDRQARVDLAAARCLPGLLRVEPHAREWSLRVFERAGELIGFAPAGSPMLGLAIDLGTTNAAGFLIDLETGERLASLGIENPQVAWGADLVSRLNHAVRGETQARELHQAAIEAINALAHDLCFSVGHRVGDILDVAICGNTAMHHLLLNLPVRQLGRAPFVAAVRDGMDLKARELGLAVAPGAWVHVAPNVGGFVGGDHVTALLATEEIWSVCQTALVMDVGTNTEISLIHDGRFYSSSAPSGPALEGGHIGCGMRAAEGAIERVRIEAGRLRVATIGGKKPIGLCGSGVLDTLATLHHGGLVSDQGRLATAHEDIVPHQGKRAVRLAKGVHFTQDDVRAVQLAKAAIRTATELLLDEAGLDEHAIERFVIAGAFGAYIDIDSGVRIGLFPDLPRERFVQVGNAAGVGIRRMLASDTARQRAGELATACRYLELSSRSDFQKRFLRHIGFHNSSSDSTTKGLVTGSSQHERRLFK
jgi:uncharacterized 2Fe-2S/4Fe-4S cluster protein (DUF4445 family)